MGCLHSNAMIWRRNNVGRKLQRVEKYDSELLYVCKLYRAHVAFVMLFYAVVIQKVTLFDSVLF